jgi:hypothetical protein
MRIPSLRHQWCNVLRTWGPVILLMALIFVTSAQPKTPPPPGAESVYFSGAMPIFEGLWEVLVKKSAHVIVYGLLTLLFMRALRRSGIGLREAANTAILLALVYALTDELHQAFVTGRNSSVLDIGFDYIGSTAAALIARWGLERRNKNSPRYQGEFAGADPHCHQGLR